MVTGSIIRTSTIAVVVAVVTSSIIVTPGVTEYELEPGTLAQPPWGSHEALGKQMFAAFDTTEQDDRLSWEELSTLLEGPLAKKEGVTSPKALFESMDTDGDGQLAWAEAKAFFVSILGIVTSRHTQTLIENLIRPEWEQRR